MNLLKLQKVKSGVLQCKLRMSRCIVPYASVETMCVCVINASVTCLFTLLTL